MPPDPNLIVHEVFSWVVPGLVIMVLGFPVVRLITRWLEPRPVPPRELSAINGSARAICWARRILEAATICIALVIWAVFLTDLMRRRMSRVLAIVIYRSV